DAPSKQASGHAKAPPGWTRGAAERPGTGSAARSPTLSHQGCSTADQGPGLGPSYLQSGLGGTGIAHHGNSRANVNNVLARNSARGYGNSRGDARDLGSCRVQSHVLS